MALALVVIPAASALAGTGPPEPGSLVRATISSEHPARDESLQVLRGVWLGLSEGSLMLQTEARPETLKLALADVRRLEVSRGLRGHAGAGAAIGLLVGLVVGVPVGLAAYEGQKADTAYVGPIPISTSIGSSAQWALGYGAAVGAIGALIGALVGNEHKSERWDPVALESLHAWCDPSGQGLRLGFRAQF